MGSGVADRLLVRGGLSAVAAVATLAAASGLAQAQEQDEAVPPPVLPEAAVSAGVAFPFGIVRDLELKRRIRALAPLDVEPGVRLFSYVGLSFRASYAPGWMASPLRDDGICDLALDVGEPCSVWSSRVGAALTFHVLPRAVIDPWASVGFTRERVSFQGRLPRTASTDPNAAPLPHGWRAGYSLVGWSFPELRGGAEVRVVGPLRLGAAVTLTWGKYEESQADCAAELPCGDVTFNPRHWHGWYGVVFRASVVWPTKP
jgi:hypothetical protein